MAQITLGSEKKTAVEFSLDQLLVTQLQETALRLHRSTSDLVQNAVHRLLQQERLGLIDLNHKKIRLWCAGCQKAMHRKGRSSTYFERADGVKACSEGCKQALDGQWSEVTMYKEF